MKLWEILVPASTTEHKIKLSHHKAWDRKVTEIAGGLTVMRPAKGSWISPSGKLFRDRMIPVRIMCGRTEIEKIAVMTIEHYGQEAVMFYAVSDDVQILHKDDKLGKPYGKLIDNGSGALLTCEEVEEIRNKRIIGAIKLVRERTGMNLTGSKALVDRFRRY